jgi:hypothetical protein|tara:strand:- start:1706 stop:2041 length:336 start_codon:yes stop_codon:yes gene_type:complete
MSSFRVGAEEHLKFVYKGQVFLCKAIVGSSLEYLAKKFMRVSGLRGEYASHSPSIQLFEAADLTIFIELKKRVVSRETVPIFARRCRRRPSSRRAQAIERFKAEPARQSGN